MPRLLGNLQKKLLPSVEINAKLSLHSTAGVIQR